jgi:vacuolar protein sorting-associated protein VTA1
MAVNLPEKLKTPDISRFAVRAAQLEKAKPVISYWCTCGGNPPGDAAAN